MTMGSQSGFPTADPLSSTFSALQLLRNYNQVLTPSVPGNNLVQVYHQYTCGTSYGDFSREDHFRPGTFSFSPMIGAFQPYSPYSIANSPPLTDTKSRQAYLTPSSVYGRRTRGEKKPIPEDQKDDRYYERRKRNNQAAKKSRDARKLREDQIALRASLLEHENAILRAQVLSLREETQCLRQLVLSLKKVSTKSVKKESSPIAVAATRKWDTEYDPV